MVKIEVWKKMKFNLQNPMTFCEKILDPFLFVVFIFVKDNFICIVCPDVFSICDYLGIA